MKARSSQKPKPKRRGQGQAKAKAAKAYKAAKAVPTQKGNPDSPETSTVQKQKGSTPYGVAKKLYFQKFLF